MSVSKNKKTSSRWKVPIVLIFFGILVAGLLWKTGALSGLKGQIISTSNFQINIDLPENESIEENQSLPFSLTTLSANPGSSTFTFSLSQDQNQNQGTMDFEELASTCQIDPGNSTDRREPQTLIVTSSSLCTGKLHLHFSQPGTVGLGLIVRTNDRSYPYLWSLTVNAPVSINTAPTPLPAEPKPIGGQQAFDSQGNFYYLSYGGGLYRVKPGGGVIEHLVTTQQTGANGFAGSVVVKGNKVYFMGAAHIYAYNLSTNNLEEFADIPFYYYGFGVLTDSTGNLYALSKGQIIHPDGSKEQDNNFSRSYAVVTDDSIYSPNSNVITKTKLADNSQISLGSGMQDLYGMAITPSGHLLSGNGNNPSKIYDVAPDGSMKTFGPLPIAVTSVTSDNDGYGYFAGYQHWTIHTSYGNSVFRFKDGNIELFGCDNSVPGLCDGFQTARAYVPPPMCGNGRQEQGEECDDGNTDHYDQCTNQCTLPRCGDGIQQQGEQCDDGNTVNGDGCDSSCHIEPPVCGNRRVEIGEWCDDGNTENGDGCSSICQNEPRCGDSIIEPGIGETCDDGNKDSGDGCDSQCKKEPEAELAGPPSDTLYGQQSFDEQKTLYAATYGGGIYTVEMYGGPITRIVSKEQANFINGFSGPAYVNRTKKKMFFQGRAGIYSYDLVTKGIEKVGKLPDGNYASGIIPDKNGNLWALGYGTVLQANGKENIGTSYQIGYYSVHDNDWIYNNNGSGISRVHHDGTGQEYSFAYGADDGYGMTVDRDGNFWIAQANQPKGAKLSKFSKNGGRPIATVQLPINVISLTNDMDNDLIYASGFDGWQTSTKFGNSILAINTKTNEVMIFGYDTDVISTCSGQYGGLQCPPIAQQTSPVCGNGQLEVAEQCDDGNLTDGDQCSATCKLEANVLTQQTPFEGKADGKSFSLSQTVNFKGLNQPSNPVKEVLFESKDTVPTTINKNPTTGESSFTPKIGGRYLFLATVKFEKNGLEKVANFSVDMMSKKYRAVRGKCVVGGKCTFRIQAYYEWPSSLLPRP